MGEFKKTVLRGDPAARGQSWNPAASNLHQWALFTRLGGIYGTGVYFLVSLIDLESSDRECADRNTSRAGPRWLVGEGDAAALNPDLLVGFITARHQGDLAAEKGISAPAVIALIPAPPVWAALTPSHAAGIQPFAPLTGRHRLAYGQRRHGAIAADPSPAAALALLAMGGKICHVYLIADMPSADAPWGGLTAVTTKVVVQVVLVGAVADPNPSKALTLEGMRLGRAELILCCS